MNIKRLIVVIIVVIIVVMGGGFTTHYLNRRGQVTTNFNVVDTKDLQMSLNGQPLALLGLHSTYSLKPGIYTLSASKTDYQTIHTQFTLQANQHQVITLALQRSINTSLDNWSQVANTANSPGVTISHVQYFYQNTWSVATISLDGGDSAIAVLAYNDETHLWNLAIGPGTSFSASSLANIPRQVVSYMQDNNYISGGTQ